MDESRELRWRIKDRLTGEILPEVFCRLSDAYRSVQTAGNINWKYVFILS